MNMFIKNSSFFDKLKNKKIVVYGAGNYGRSFIEAAVNELGAGIEAVADSNWKNIIDWTDQDVIAPEEVTKRDFDIIYIAILNEKVCQNIKSNLINMGIEEDKILYYGIGDVRIDEIKNILKLMQNKLVL
jgi:prephenate dehydrogenase